MFRSLLTLAALAVAGTASATQYDVGDDVSLSDDQVPDFGLAAKVKINRTGSGKLVVVYGDGAGGTVYDVKADAERPARDLFSRVCDAKNTDCGDLANWSAPINLSNTAGLSSASTAWRGLAAGALPYPGDSDKPNIFTNGNDVLVSWVDKYCPGGEQGSISYLERDDKEVPFSCTYVVRSANAGASWSAPQQLSDGWRDAKQDVHRGSTNAWVITWQEDPEGLQLGEADGPGDGASGANTSKGTDIWYTALPRADVTAGVPFPAPVRVTDNFTKIDRRQGTTTDRESGQTAASRANLAVVGSTVLLAYEETKGTGGADSGKVIRYHAFPYDQPPTSCAVDAGAPGDTAMDPACEVNPRGEPYPAIDDPARAGCILSAPDENARRVRFFAQGTPGTNSGTKLFIFWKQGLYDQGGPSDIIARAGVVTGGQTGALAGFGVDDFQPPVAQPTATQVGDVLDGCYVLGDDAIGDGAFGNAPGMNLSANTETGGDLFAGTDDSNNEDARAHRGIMKGDFIALGYSYTPDWAVARYTDFENYEFWLRTSPDGGQTWTTPVDLTSSTTAAMAAARGWLPSQINVKEPRIVKTPGSGPGCPSGDPGAPDTTHTEDCTDGKAFVVAWGTETNVYEHLGGAEDLDLYITRTTNKGVTFETPVAFAAAEADDLESQINLTPDGSRAYLVWNSEGAVETNAMFALAQSVEGEICNGVDDDGDGLVDGDDPDVPDFDHDGYNVCLDCDDADPSVNPGAQELIGDEIDQDCDGFERCYVDDDLDGARGAASRLSVDATCGFGGLATVWDPKDCWDGNAVHNADDVDGDGYSSCDGDCDDFDMNVQACPGQPWLTGASPLVAGTTGVWQVRGATPGKKAYLGVGTPGASVPLPCGAEVGIGGAVVLGNARAAANGSSVYAASVPMGLEGNTYAFQIFEPATCSVSNVLVRTIE